MSRTDWIAVAIAVAGSFAAGCCDAKAEPERLASQPPAAYEWHTLVAAPGQLDAVHVRLRDGKPAFATQRSMQRLRTTAWSPLPAAGPQAVSRVFERRTYRSPDAAKREALLRRFESHTMKLFAKHGMTNVIYWTPDGGPDSDTQLVYLLAHDSTDASKESFAAFRQDPDWIAAKTASETAAGGSLTTKDKGVVSEFLSPSAYSPLR